MTIALEPRKDEELFEQAMGYCAIVAMGMVLWWLFLPPLIADFVRNRKKSDEARQLLDLLYTRYQEVCYRVGAEPLSENWFNHYDVVLRLDALEQGKRKKVNDISSEPFPLGDT